MRPTQTNNKKPGYVVMKRIAACVIVSGALLVGLGGCSWDYLAEKIIPEEESAYARDFLEKLRRREFNDVMSQLDASLISQVSDDKLIEIAGYFPAGEPISIEIIGSQTHSSTGRWQGNFTFEYQFQDQWAVASATVQRVDERMTVVGFRVWQTTASQRELTSVWAADLSPWHFIMLFLTVLSPAFMVYTCYRVYKTPIPRKKRRWYLISFVGLFGFSFNWTTGVLNYQLAEIQLIGFGILAAGPHAPWILEFTVPVGAAVFWLMRKKLMAPSPGIPDENLDLDATNEK